METAYDYRNQAWAQKDGSGAFVYVPCGHPNDDCGCYGKRYAGMPVEDARVLAELAEPA